MNPPTSPKNVANALSLLRAPLALLLLVEAPHIRLLAIGLAMLTDSIDGYLARRSKTTSRVGAVLDPAMDKFFVFFAIAVLLYEHKLAPWQALSMFSRDFALCLFGLYLSLSGRWQTYEFRSIRWGKVTTALQFLILSAVTLGYSIPPYFFYAFVTLGLLALYELFQFKKLPHDTC